MRRLLIWIGWEFLREWRFFNLPTEREEKTLRRWKRALDLLANLVWKVLLALGTFFEVKRRRESRGRQKGIFFV